MIEQQIYLSHTTTRLAAPPVHHLCHLIFQTAEVGTHFNSVTRVEIYHAVKQPSADIPRMPRKHHIGVLSARWERGKA